MSATVVFDLDKVLLGGDASTLFLRGRLRESPARALPLLAAAPLLLPGAVVPQLRPLAARAMTRLAVAGHDRTDVQAAAAAYREAVARAPQTVIADAVAAVRRHRADGEDVVVATGCEETLARGFLHSIGLADLEVVGSTGSFRPPRIERAMGEWKVRLLARRGYPPPWAAVYSDSDSDLPLLAGTPHPVLVNADARTARRVARVLGLPAAEVTWR